MYRTYRVVQRNRESFCRVARSFDRAIKLESCVFEGAFAGKILLLRFAILFAIVQSGQNWENYCVFGATLCDFWQKTKHSCNFSVKNASCAFCANFANILRFLNPSNTVILNCLPMILNIFL